MKKVRRIVVIGVSAGGLKALRTILPHLPAGYPLPVAAVIHRYPKYTGDHLERFLDRECSIRVKQAEEGERIRPGVACFAPPGKHMMVDAGLSVSLSGEGYVNCARPSADVLFNSATDACGPAVVGVVLTGTNSDGSLGLKKIKEGGGLAIVQSPETAEAQAMPRSAIEVAEPGHILDLDKIGPFLANQGCLQ